MPPVNFSSPGKNYRGWASRLSVTMRQAHIGGDKLFVDYAGDTVPVIVDRLTGQVRPAQIFVAVMVASNFTYAEAKLDPKALADWIGNLYPSFRSALAAYPNCWCRTTPRTPSSKPVAVIKACPTPFGSVNRKAVSWFVFMSDDGYSFFTLSKRMGFPRCAAAATSANTHSRQPFDNPGGDDGCLQRMVLHLTLTNELRSVNGPNYGRIYDADVVDTLVEDPTFGCLLYDRCRHL